MSSIKVAVIGVGNMGFHHARIYAQMAGAQLVAVADVDEARACEVAQRFGCKPYSHYADLLEHEQPDAVSVAAPTSLHSEIGLDVISAGSHVLIEKPLAGSLHDADELVRASEQAGVVLGVGHVERFNPAVQALKRCIDEGELGIVTSIIAKRVGVMPPQIKDANVIVDIAVHDIDVINYLLGTLPTEVDATAGRALLSDRYDHAELFLKYDQMGCFILANWITPMKVRTLSVTGNAGHAELNYVSQKLEIYENHIEKRHDDFGDFVVRFGTPRVSVAPIAMREPLKLELEAFVDAVKGKQRFPVTGDEGVKTLRVVDLILKHLSVTETCPAR